MVGTRDGLVELDGTTTGEVRWTLADFVFVCGGFTLELGGVPVRRGADVMVPRRESNHV